MKIHDKFPFSKKQTELKQKKKQWVEREKVVFVVACIFIIVLFILTVYAVAYTVSRLKLWL